MDMSSLYNPRVLDELHITDEHRDRLEWFLKHKGQILPYSQLAAVENPGLTSLPKGIYKPQGWKYSLSIKETLNSPYGDIPIATLANGDWVYRYHREDGENKYTNIGLLNCLRDGIPVGVIIQVEPKPNVQYFVAGLGLITQFHDPWFNVVNYSATTSSEMASKLVAENPYLYDGAQKQGDLPGFMGDVGAERYSKQLVRPNQPMFRVMLLSTYEKTCAITQTQVVPALEAAHIRPYSYDKMDKVRNGLLLRADIHRLFDEGYIGVDTSNMETVLSPRLIGTNYEQYERTPLVLPTNQELQPSAQLLDEHRRNWSL